MHWASIRALQGCLPCRSSFSQHTQILVRDQVQSSTNSVRLLRHACTKADGSKPVSGQLYSSRSAQQGPGHARRKRRLDDLCAELYGEHSLRALQSWIAQGKVTANGKTVTKAGTPIAADADVQLSVKVSKYVSRAGYKLEAALDHLGWEVQGLRALDAGISTGGFSDCLLQRGVSALIGVDVGYGQVAERVRTDSRLALLERTNLRLLQLQDLPEARPCQLATLDLSFIALTTVLPAVVGLLAPGARVVALVKPQFEAPRDQVAAGGIVEDLAVHEQIFEKVVAAAKVLGLEFQGRVQSPIRGRVGGNQEFLVGFELQ